MTYGSKIKFCYCSFSATTPPQKKLASLKELLQLGCIVVKTIGPGTIHNIIHTHYNSLFMHKKGDKIFIQAILPNLVFKDLHTPFEDTISFKL